ncbi:hypothetical protein D3C78_1534950 [compost metagenome]
MRFGSQLRLFGGMLFGGQTGSFFGWLLVDSKRRCEHCCLFGNQIHTLRVGGLLQRYGLQRFGLRLHQLGTCVHCSSCQLRAFVVWLYLTNHFQCSLKRDLSGVDTPETHHGAGTAWE